MKHVTHEGNIYELTASLHPGGWDEHVGELIHLQGEDYLIRQIVFMHESMRPKRIAKAFFKSVATLIITFRLSQASTHWEGAWTGKKVKRFAHKL